MTDPFGQKSNETNHYYPQQPFYSQHSYTPYSQYRQSSPYASISNPSNSNPSISNPSNDQLFKQISVTLTELNKAIENAKMMVETAQSTGLWDLINTSKNNISMGSLIKLFKSIDYQQIYALIQSPLVQQILSDPNFYQLFAPDTGTTPGTSLNEIEHELMYESKEKESKEDEKK